ncbi:kinase-like domain-containing protein [Apiosordaria backusii]|uniref:Kinase-like domain-containing protein n=1 Tax=Apiosordaria backusii TaxID=314023 RepID=A0AA40B232_9PEZI|nr:kinase-like domain-containing protein [Apiosordaria backusii]
MESHTPLYTLKVDEVVSDPVQTPLAGTRQVSNPNSSFAAKSLEHITRDSPHTSTANTGSKRQSRCSTEYTDSDSSVSSSSLESSASEGVDEKSHRPIALRGGLGTPTANDLDRKVAIDESDSELRGAQERTPSTGQKSPKVNQTARAPFRGDGGVPVVELRHKQIHETDPSEITDFGNGLHYRDPDRKARFLQRRKSRSHNKDRKSLQTRLFESLHPLDDEEKEKGFIPVDHLPLLITEESVYEELSTRLRETHDESTILRYARKICAETTEDRTDGKKTKTKAVTFRKIFAILVLVEKSSAITKFLREHINDSDLPLIRIKKRPGECDLRCSRKPDRKLKCFKGGWSPLQIRNFEEWQWTTLAPFFSKSEGEKEVNHYVLQDRVIMPFLTDPNKRIISNDPFIQTQQEELLGGGGRCSGAPCTCTFAIKRLHSQRKEEFKREVDMLKRFSSLNDAHPHLISLLATYEQRKSYFLIFPYAEADLFSYWDRVEPEPIMDQATVKWVAEQCKGIASGVLKIHKYKSTNSKVANDSLKPAGLDEPFGHHGDIKPENVLWFPYNLGNLDENIHVHYPTNDNPSNTRGTLKLTDFGLASTSAHRTVSRKPHSHFGMTYNYRAPECDIHGKHDPKGRQYDMWTLGCLYLEFVTWLIGGKALLDEFTQLRLWAKASDAENPKKQFRLDHYYGGGLFPNEAMPSDTFFEIVEDDSLEGQKRGGWKAIVKPAVTDFMSMLHSHPKCTKFLHDFLKMIEDGLLVVKQGDPHKRDRYTIQEVHAKLVNMNQRCETLEYSCNPAA